MKWRMSYIEMPQQQESTSEVRPVKKKKKTTSPTVQFSVFLVAMGTGNWNWDSLRIDC